MQTYKTGLSASIALVLLITLDYTKIMEKLNTLVIEEGESSSDERGSGNSRAGSVAKNSCAPRLKTTKNSVFEMFNEDSEGRGSLFQALVEHW